MREHDCTWRGTRISNRVRQKPDRCDQQCLVASMRIVALCACEKKRSRIACLSEIRYRARWSVSKAPGTFLVSARPGAITPVL